MKVEMRSKNFGDVISKAGDVIGHVEKTSEAHQLEWVAFEKGKVYFDQKPSHSPEQAAVRLMQHLEKKGGKK